MLLWFAGSSVLLTWAVFKSPALDYRLVALGAVLPVAEVVTGGPAVLHTLLAAVAVLAVVMLATRRRRLLRRRLLGLPIGLFWHLVLDGDWSRTQLFWWPAFGWSFGSGGMPELDRGPTSLLLELVGAGVIAWCYHRFGLADRARRRQFLRTGQLPRDAVA